MAAQDTRLGKSKSIGKWFRRGEHSDSVTGAHEAHAGPQTNIADVWAAASGPRSRRHAASESVQPASESPRKLRGAASATEVDPHAERRVHGSPRRSRRVHSAHTAPVAPPSEEVRPTSHAGSVIPEEDLMEIRDRPVRRKKPRHQGVSSSATGSTPSRSEEPSRMVLGPALSSTAGSNAAAPDSSRAADTVAASLVEDETVTDETPVADTSLSIARSQLAPPFEKELETAPRERMSTASRNTLPAYLTTASGLAPVAGESKGVMPEDVRPQAERSESARENAASAALARRAPQSGGVERVGPSSYVARDVLVTHEHNYVDHPEPVVLPPKYAGKALSAKTRARTEEYASLPSVPEPRGNPPLSASPSENASTVTLASSAGVLPSGAPRGAGSRTPSGAARSVLMGDRRNSSDTSSSMHALAPRSRKGSDASEVTGTTGGAASSSALPSQASVPEHVDEPMDTSSLSRTAEPGKALPAISTVLYGGAGGVGTVAARKARENASATDDGKAPSALKDLAPVPREQTGGAGGAVGVQAAAAARENAAATGDDKAPSALKPVAALPTEVGSLGGLAGALAASAARENASATDDAKAPSALKPESATGIATLTISSDRDAEKRAEPAEAPRPAAVPSSAVKTEPVQHTASQTRPAPPIHLFGSKLVMENEKETAGKPVEAKPVETKPVEAKPVEAAPVETKPADKAVDQADLGRSSQGRAAPPISLASLYGKPPSSRYSTDSAASVPPVSGTATATVPSTEPPTETSSTTRAAPALRDAIVSKPVAAESTPVPSAEPAKPAEPAEPAVEKPAAETKAAPAAEEPVAVTKEAPAAEEPAAVTKAAPEERATEAMAVDEPCAKAETVQELSSKPTAAEESAGTVTAAGAPTAAAAPAITESSAAEKQDAAPAPAEKPAPAATAANEPVTEDAGLLSAGAPDDGFEDMDEDEEAEEGTDNGKNGNGASGSIAAAGAGKTGKAKAKAKYRAKVKARAKAAKAQVTDGAKSAEA